jgi:CRP-like cAMP-binding protein
MTTTAPPIQAIAALAALDRLRLHPTGDLRCLASDTDVVRVAAGDVIERAGARARQLVGIVDGYVAGRSDDGHEVILGPGSDIGGHELLADTPHALTYTALTPATFVVVFGPAFRALAPLALVP